MKRVFLYAAAFAVISSAGLAQSPPSPVMSYDFVPTPAQWNNYFKQKQDALNFTPLNIAGGVLSGRLVTAQPSATRAGFNLTPGTDPGSPVEGDLWATATALKVRINGTTVTLGGASNAPAATLFGNPTASGTPNANFTISSLTARGVPDANNDLVAIYDAASGTIKKVTPGQIASAAAAGVTSIAGNIGAFTLGTGLTNNTNQIAFAAIAADSFWMNGTGSSAVPTQKAFPSCSSSTSALTYNISTHLLECHTVGLGTVTSVAAGTGLTGGTITGSGTIGLSVPVAASLGGTGVSSPSANTIPINQGGSAQTNTGVGGEGYCLVGTGAAPGFRQGCRNLISVQNASNSGALVFNNLNSNYNEYVFTLKNVLPSAAGVGFLAEFSVDNGSTWQTSSYAGASILLAGNSASTIIINSTNLALSNTNVNNSSGYGFTGYFSLPNLATGNAQNAYWNLLFQTNTSGISTSVIGSGYWQNGTAVNAVRFRFTSGNIASGQIRMVGQN